MPTTSAKVPGTLATYAGGGVLNWTGAVATVQADDASEATSGAGTATSYVLRLSNFGFTTSDIPSGAVITKVSVRTKRRKGGGSVSDTVAQLAIISAGTSADRIGSNASAGAVWPTSGTAGGGSYTTFEFTAGLPTDSQLRSSSFAFDFQESHALGQGYLGHVDLTVDYTVPIVPANASHGHAATSPSIAPKSSIAAANAAHGSTSTGPSLTPHAAVTPADAAHAHTATQPVLIISGINPDDGQHDHAASQPSIGWAGVISPANASHGHQATSPSIAVHYTLTINSAHHGHASTSPIIFKVIVSPPGRRFNLAPSSSAMRRFQIAPSTRAMRRFNLEG